MGFKAETKIQTKNKIKQKKKKAQNHVGPERTWPDPVKEIYYWHEEVMMIALLAKNHAESNWFRFITPRIYKYLHRRFYVSRQSLEHNRQKFFLLY